MGSKPEELQDSYREDDLFCLKIVVNFNKPPTLAVNIPAMKGVFQNR